TYAIDPYKIAIVGDCNGGPLAIDLAGANQDIFSQLVTISGWFWAGQARYIEPPRSGHPMDILIEDDFRSRRTSAMLEDVTTLRQAGHRVTMSLQLRRHGYQRENFDYVGRWLH